MTYEFKLIHPKVGDQVDVGGYVGKIIIIDDRIVVSGIYYDYCSEDVCYEDPWTYVYKSEIFDQLAQWDPLGKLRRWNVSHMEPQFGDGNG